MTLKRRDLLLSTLAVPLLVTTAVALVSRRDQFHLPLRPDTELWRRLVRAERPSAWTLPIFPADVEELEGARVTIRGFMLPLHEAARHRSFILAANPIGCPGCERPGFSMMIRIAADQAVAPTGRSLVFSGILRIERGAELPYRLLDAVPA
jgi:uncharacterized protein